MTTEKIIALTRWTFAIQLMTLLFIMLSMFVMENEMPTYSSILAWEIPWTELFGGLQSMGSQESDTT